MMPDETVSGIRKRSRVKFIRTGGSTIPLSPDRSVTQKRDVSVENQIRQDGIRIKRSANCGNQVQELCMIIRIMHRFPPAMNHQEIFRTQVQKGQFFLIWKN